MRAAARASPPANLEEALELFEDGGRGSSCSRCRKADRALERTYLLGSAASPGLAERAFAVEIEQGVGVVERLLEYEFEGPFDFEGADEPRSVAVRGKVDRIDVLADGTLRVIDYKLGTRAEARARPAAAGLRRLRGAGSRRAPRPRRGRWPAPATSLSRRRTRSSSSAASGNVEAARATGRQRFLDAIDADRAGHFPPIPRSRGSAPAAAIAARLPEGLRRR